MLQSNVEPPIVVGTLLHYVNDGNVLRKTFIVDR